MREKEITIYDLALRVNISAATVSRGLKDHPAINKATKKKIFDFAKGTGIVPGFNTSFMQPP